MNAAHAEQQRGSVRCQISKDADEWEIYAYRDHTLALLRRYLRLSLELGRLPSLLGGELFRARVTAYRVTSFEDLVIFVHDVENCLDRMSDGSRRIIARILFQEYTEEEVAGLMGCTVRTARRWYHEALDEASQMLLRLRLMEPFNEVGERLAGEGVDRTARLRTELPSRKAPVFVTAAEPQRTRREERQQGSAKHPIHLVNTRF